MATAATIMTEAAAAAMAEYRVRRLPVHHSHSTEHGRLRRTR